MASVAYCWRSGQIAVGRGSSIPFGALLIAPGTADALREAIAGCGRLSYDGKTWIVPGVPEAADEDAALDALIAFRAHVAERLAPRRAA